MNWSIGTPVVQSVVEPQTVSINVSKGNNQLLVLLLATRDGRDNYYNIATFNGLPMTTWGHIVRNDGAGEIASIHGLYFNCAGLAAGNYNLVKEVTTGGPDGGLESWFMITGNASKLPVKNTSSAYGAGSSISNSIAVSLNDMLVLTAVGSEPDSMPSTGGGQTDLVKQYSSGTFLGCSYKVSNPGNVNMNYSQTNDRWAQITMTIKKADNGGAFLLNFM